MTKTIKEETITFTQYKDLGNDIDIRIFVQGFAPTYAPVICTKGQPKTMGDIVEKLENLLGVKITLGPPEPPKP